MAQSRLLAGTFATLAFTVALGIWSKNHFSLTKKAPPLTLKKLDPSKKAPKRGIAGAAPRCLKDRMTPEWIREETQRLEEAQPQTRERGRMHGVNLANIPSSQARFLRENEHWISNANRSAPRCADLLCVINRIYSSRGSSNTATNTADDTSSNTPSNTNEEAWNIYGFFLKTGYSISLLDRLPDPRQAVLSDAGHLPSQGATLSEHLFSLDELRGLWTLAWTLPPAYLKLTSLQRFHRVPMGEDQLPRGWHNETCAASIGNRSRGFIEIRKCMEFNILRGQLDPRYALPRDDGIRGNFFKTISHEMTHHLDREAATLENDFTPISLQEEWLSLSGWHLNIVTDPATGETLGYDWTTDPTREGFVRAYAGNSPGEDFAETAAWARYWPELAAQLVPQKTAFIARKFFGGRTYDPQGLSDFYVDTATNSIANELLDATSACSSPTQTSDPTACMNAAIDEKITAAFESLRATEWEACDHLALHETALGDRVLTRLHPMVAEVVSQNPAGH